MNEREHALKLHAQGEYNTYSALQRINDDKRQDQRISKKEFLKRLRNAGFLSAGFSSKPHDPNHNKPHKWVREMGWARKEQLAFIHKGTEITGYYDIAVYTQQGMQIIEKIICNPEFNLHKYRNMHEQTQDQPIIKVNDKIRSEQAADDFRANLDQLFKAS